MQTISTGDVPARERLSYLHDYVSAHIAGLRFRPGDADGFRFHLATEQLGEDTLLARTRYSAVAGARSDLLGDGRGNYVLSIHDTDYEVEAGGRSWTVRAGDVVIVDESERYGFRLPGTGSRLVALDRARLAAAAPLVASRPAHHFGSGTPRAALLSGYIDLLLATPRDGNGAMLADHVYALVASMLQSGERSAPPRGGIAGARLSLIKADIEKSLGNPALSVSAVARRQGLTPRYVQQLFARDETSFSDFVRERRLDRALERLRDGACLDTSIAALAFDCGFGDLSSFNRAFRKRFGATPSDIRARAIERRRAGH